MPSTPSLQYGVLRNKVDSPPPPHVHVHRHLRQDQLIQYILLLFISCFNNFNQQCFSLEGDDYTKLGLAVVVLILEGLHAVCYRRVLKDKNSSDHYQLCFISLSCSGRAWSWTGCVHLCSSTWWLSVLLFGFLN